MLKESIRTLRERSEPGAPPSAASLRAEDSERTKRKRALEKRDDDSREPEPSAHASSRAKSEGSTEQSDGVGPRGIKQ